MIDNYYFDKDRNPPLPFSAKVFDSAILSSVTMAKIKDKVEITLPVGLSHDDEPFSFTCHEIDGDTLEFRDGGKTLKILSKKLDLSTFKNRITEYCKKTGRLCLKGERELSLKIYPQGKMSLLWDLYDFIHYCATVANFDLYPMSYDMAWFGKESGDE